MNELMYERKVWNVYTNGNTINLLPIIDPNSKLIHITQIQNEVQQLIEAGWIEIDKDDMKCGVFRSGANESGSYVVAQYVPVKESLDNQPNV